MANYNVDIAVAVKNLNAIKSLKRELDAVEKSLNAVKKASKLDAKDESGFRKRRRHRLQEKQDLLDQKRITGELKRAEAARRAELLKGYRLQRQEELRLRKLSEQRMKGLGQYATSIGPEPDRIGAIRRKQQQQRLAASKQIIFQTNLELALAEQLLGTGKRQLNVKQKITDEQQRQIKNAQALNAQRDRALAKEKKQQNNAERERKAKRSARINAAVTGGAFPLLFGGGIGQALGGAVGGAISGQLFGGLTVALQVAGSFADQFRQNLNTLTSSLESATGIVEGLGDAGIYTSPRLAKTVDELESQGRFVDAYRVSLAKLEQVYGPNGVAMLNMYNQSNINVQSEISRLIAQLQTGLLPVMTSVNQLFAGFLRLGNDVVESGVLQDMIPFFREIDLIGKDLTELSKGTNLFGFNRGDQGAREAKRKEQAELAIKNERIIEQINARQLKIQQKKNQLRQEELNFQKQEIDLRFEANRIELSTMEARIRMQNEMFRERGKFLEAQKAANSALLGAGLQRARGSAELTAANLPTFGNLAPEPLDALFEKIQKIRFAQINEEVHEFSATLEASGMATGLIVAHADALREILEKLELKTLTEEFIDLTRAQQGLADVPVMQGSRGLFSGDLSDKAIFDFDTSIASAIALDAELQKILDKNPQIEEVSNAMAQSFVGGLQAMVAGTKTAEEAFADFLMSIADALASTAAQMIGTYIAMGIARAFATGGSLGTPPGAEAQAAGLNVYNTPTVPFTTGFAEGGYVSGPTRALVGEGGEPEYVIPESKMRESMSRYSRGARGSAVIPETGTSGTSGEGGVATAAPIDVRYTVERINSVDYVTADQFQSGMQQAAAQGAKQGEQQTLKRLQMSGSTRKRIGL